MSEAYLGFVFFSIGTNSFFVYKGINISNVHKDHEVQHSTVWVQCLVPESIYVLHCKTLILLMCYHGTVPKLMALAACGIKCATAAILYGLLKPVWFSLTVVYAWFDVGMSFGFGGF